jgi:cytidylate kinase
MAIITICRGSKSGGQALAECLADRLQYPLLGREVIQQAAAELGVSEESLSQKMEQAPRLWDRHAVIRRVYVVAVQAALAEHIGGGNLVYHGLAGQLLLKGLPAVLRTRLIAPLELRLRVLIETEGMDRFAAEQFIRRVDAQRARWVRMMYGEDIEDPALYDMVVNLETMSIPVACGLLTTTLTQPDFAITDHVKEQLADFRLACQVKRALVSAPETRGFGLEVEAQDGVVEVSGAAPLQSTGKTGDRISEIARSVAGVATVRLKLQWFDPYP